MTALLLAHADGPGAGHFLGRAIWDPLRGGSRLAEASASRSPALDIFELRFSRPEPDASEVVRCAIDEHGRPCHVEIWLVPGAPPGGSLQAAASLAGLVAANPNLVRVTFLGEGLVELTDASGNTAIVPARAASALVPSQPAADRW